MSELRAKSARQRQGTAKVRSFDESTRKEIKRKRLDSLEADNWQEDRRKDDEEDDDYNPLDDDESGDGAPRYDALLLAGSGVHDALPMSPPACTCTTRSQR